MRILVTGATGFVGQYLLALLNRRRHTVFGTYLAQPSCAPPAGTDLLACDLRDRDQVLRVVRDARPQHVYHLAGLSSVIRSLSESRETWDTNFGGTMNLLEALREEAPAARTLLVGTGQCYGHVPARHLPVAEEQALAPESPYAASKAAADLLGLQFFSTWGLEVIRARPFNHTGPGQAPEFVCSDWARQVAEIDLGMRPAVLYVGNINAARDFSDVRDVVRAYELLMRYGKPGEAYNVTSGRATPLKWILRHLLSLCSRPAKIVVQKHRVRTGEVARFYGSNRKLRRVTGWKPEHPLGCTLDDLYAGWRENLRSPAVPAATAPGAYPAPNDSRPLQAQRPAP